MRNCKIFLLLAFNDCFNVFFALFQAHLILNKDTKTSRNICGLFGEDSKQGQNILGKNSKSGRMLYFD
jgi:hypothetical protein